METSVAILCVLSDDENVCFKSVNILHITSQLLSFHGLLFHCFSFVFPAAFLPNIFSATHLANYATDVKIKLFRCSYEGAVIVFLF